MRLYGYWRSSSSYRTRISLNLKGLEYDQVAVHLLNDGGEQHRGEFVAKSPLHQVPVLEVEGSSGPRYLSQSVAIMEWLEETYPDPPLYPREPWPRARAREMVEMINSGIQPLQNLRVLRSLKALGANPRQWCREVIHNGLAAVEARMAETAKRFAVGDAPGAVEACLIPQMYAAR
ncbi:MAG: maleylacetoacetate isomerase, partial [Myxococcota bacterium]